MYNIAKLLTTPERKNGFGQSALHFTARTQDFNLTHLILQGGANVNTIDVFENTPLSIACIDVPNKLIVKLLLQYGADINFNRKLHMDLFLECVLNCHSSEQLKIIKLLIEKGINVNMTDKITNRNCMHLVAINGNVTLAKLLLKNGAILDIRDNFNSTPIQIAKNHGNRQMITLFETFLEKNV